MNAIKKRLKSKTYITAIILGTITIVEAQWRVLTPLIPAEYHPFLPLLFPVAMMVLRELTNSAVADK